MKRSDAMKIRNALDNLVAKIVESPAEINDNMIAIRPWTEGAFAIGDVRMYEGIPYKCVQAHDGTGVGGWQPPNVPALWMQYHGTSKETARPWIAPAGAHDMYRAGEYMVWIDGAVYRCAMDTVYTPEQYAAGWQKVEV